MTRPDGRISAGQSVQSAMSARAWNRFCDAADIVLGNRYGITGQPIGRPPYGTNIVLIRNNSGADLERLGVLGISGVAIDPSVSLFNALQFLEKPVLTGVTPTTSEHSERFVVVVEPIAANAIGRAVVSGVFACKVNITNANHQFADVRNNDRTQLASADCGVCQLLWKESGTGANKWALGCM